MRLRKYLCRSLLLSSAVLSFVLSGCDGDNGAGSGGGGGGSYESVTIGGMVWMKKNLNIETADSWCYGEGGSVSNGVGGYTELSSSEIQSNCNKYGRLYTWAAAKKACPSGWRLPDTADWRKLVNATGGSFSAGKKLKSTSGWNDYNGESGNGTDDFGFSALPGGFRTPGGIFADAGNTGCWKTATEYNSDNDYQRFMIHDGTSVLGSYFNKNYGYSVRCVQK